MFSEFAEIALVASRLGQFLQILKTRMILILNLLSPMRLPVLIPHFSHVNHVLPPGSCHFVIVKQKMP